MNRPAPERARCRLAWGRRGPRRRRRGKPSSASRPDRIVDYLTLVGDSVDNVPGVDKVGPKTAAKWLAQYGSLDEIVAHAADVKGAVGDNLRRALDWLPMGRKLVTVKCDCPLESVADIATSLVPRDEDRTALMELFDRYGFKTWLKEVSIEDAAVNAAGESDAEEAVGVIDETLPSARPDADVERRYETILTSEALAEWIARIDAAELTAFDTETTSLDPMAAKLVGLSFSVGRGPRGLPAARPSIDGRRSARAAAVRRDARATQAVAGGRDQAEGGAEPQVRHARAGQPRHRAGRASRTTRCCNRTCSSRTAITA